MYRANIFELDLSIKHFQGQIQDLMGEIITVFKLDKYMYYEASAHFDCVLLLILIVLVIEWVPLILLTQRRCVNLWGWGRIYHAENHFVTFYLVFFYVWNFSDLPQRQSRTPCDRHTATSLVEICTSYYSHYSHLHYMSTNQERTTSDVLNSEFVR